MNKQRFVDICLLDVESQRRSIEIENRINNEVYTREYKRLMDMESMLEKIKSKDFVEDKPLPIINDGEFGKCPTCGYVFNSELLHEYTLNYCIFCGQALKKEV